MQLSPIAMLQCAKLFLAHGSFTFPLSRFSTFTGKESSGTQYVMYYVYHVWFV